MGHAVQNRAAETVIVFGAGCAGLRRQLGNAVAPGKRYTKDNRLERAWRTHMLLCLLEFSGADGLGRNDFRSLLWHVSNITCNQPGLSCELFAAPKSGGCAACRFEPRRHTHVWSANSETVQKRHSRKRRLALTGSNGNDDRAQVAGLAGGGFGGFGELAMLAD